MNESGNLHLKRSLEAAKRDLEAEYRRKAQTLDAALAILEEIGPNLQSADVAKLMSPEAKAPPEVADMTTENEAEPDAHSQPDSEDEANSERGEHETGAAQDQMWEDASAHNGTLDKPFILREQIQEAVKEFRGGDFYQKDVTKRIEEKYPERKVHSGSVSNTLSKLAKRGELRVVKPSRGGSDPALYKEAAVSP